jgi:putative tricarboxylic transport membrane protein
MRKAEFFSSIFLLIFSLVACLDAYKLLLGKPGAPGPGLYPFLMGGILFGLACLYFFRTLRAWQKEKEIDLWRGLRWGKVVLVLALLLSYAVFLEKVGFLLCTFFLLMFLFRWVDRQRWYWVYGGSLGITVLCYVIFKIWLKIQLPVGLLRI